jgi:hypothetical protein
MSSRFYYACTDADLKTDLVERTERVKGLREQLKRCKEQNGDDDEEEEACMLDKSMLDTVNKQASDIYRKRKRYAALLGTCSLPMSVQVETFKSKTFLS